MPNFTVKIETRGMLSPCENRFRYAEFTTKTQAKKWAKAQRCFGKTIRIFDVNFREVSFMWN